MEKENLVNLSNLLKEKEDVSNSIKQKKKEFEESIDSFIVENKNKKEKTNDKK